jgi:hypothetical protein
MNEKNSGMVIKEALNGGNYMFGQEKRQEFTKKKRGEMQERRAEGHIRRISFFFHSPNGTAPKLRD